MTSLEYHFPQPVPILLFVAHPALLFRLRALGDLISTGLALSLSLLFFPPTPTVANLVTSAACLALSACKTRIVEANAWIISPSRSGKVLLF